MENKNDWRLTNQMQYLDGKTLKYVSYEEYSKEWNHEHCEFCWGKFSKGENYLHEGYCSLDNYRWICSECYEDFKGMFAWKIENEENKTPPHSA